MLRNPDVALADTLKMLRELRGLSQEDLAGEVGIATSSLSRIERALMNPAWSLVRQLATVLGVSIAELAVAVEDRDSG
jgi:transcriptional regulator with XRE-family HTH domain